MRPVILTLLLCCGTASAADVVCINGRCLLPRNRQTVVVSESPVTTTVVAPTSVVAVSPRGVVTAQQHADRLAATGGFSHCTNYGGGYEGLGFSTVSPDDAVRRCCYWGRRPVREIATAWCPKRRGYVAVVRYN